jgi:hypothetical protein
MKLYLHFPLAPRVPNLTCYTLPKHPSLLIGGKHGTTGEKR